MSLQRIRTPGRFTAHTGGDTNKNKPSQGVYLLLYEKGARKHPGGIKKRGPTALTRVSPVAGGASSPQDRLSAGSTHQVIFTKLLTFG